MYKPIFQGFLLLAATAVVIIFAYYTTVIIGKKANRLFDGRYTQILERTMVGLNTNIIILKINRKIYIIAMQGKTVQLLDIIDEEDWDFSDNRDKTQFNRRYMDDDFLIGRLFNKFKKGSNSKIYSQNGSDNNE